MMRMARSFRKAGYDRKGAAMLEFALVAPVLIALLFGIASLGIYFLAQAGLRSAVEDAARYATTWPRPTEAQISARITARRFGMKTAQIVPPTITFTSSSPNYVTITMGYNVTIDYILGSRTVALTETRRAYVTS